MRRDDLGGSTTPARLRTFATSKPRWSAPRATAEKGESKLFDSADSAVADIKSGSTILSSGFGLCGVAGMCPLGCDFIQLLKSDPLPTETLISALARRRDSLHSLTAVSNNAGKEDIGGLAVLIRSGQLSRLVLSFLGNNKLLEHKYLTGEIGVELCPQGTLAERIRAAGAGIPAFFTPTGARMFDVPYSSRHVDAVEVLETGMC